MSEGRWIPPDVEHTLKNHLAIIVGYCDLMLAELAESDARVVDLTEIRNAALAAGELLNGAETV